MKIFPFPRRLPFKIEIAPGYIKFPRYRSNYRCRRYIKFAPPSKFPLLNSNPRISIPIPTFEKLKRSRFIDRDHRSSSFLPSLGKKGRFELGWRERKGRFEDPCSRQRRPFRRPFSGRPSVTRSVARVSSRRSDEHVNYYRQGSLAKLQPR